MQKVTGSCPPNAAGTVASGTIICGIRDIRKHDAGKTQTELQVHRCVYGAGCCVTRRVLDRVVTAEAFHRPSL